VVGVRKRCQVPLEWVCGNILGRGERNFAIVRFEVGNGTHSSFWHDWWCGDRSLKQCFPALFSIVRNKDAMVEDNLVVHNGVIQWNVLFTRQIQD
jgi:hypothetical protein